MNKGDGKGPTADSQLTVEAPQPTVREFLATHSMDNKIIFLDGANLRQLIGGLCLCSPGILGPAKILRTPFWKAIRKLLLEDATLIS